MKTTIDYHTFELKGNVILVSYNDDEDNVIDWIENVNPQIEYNEFLQICKDFH